MDGSDHTPCAGAAYWKRKDETADSTTRKSIGSGSIRQNRRILYPPLVQSPVSTEPTPSYIHLLPTSTTTPSSSSFSRRTSLTRVNTIDKMDQPGSQNDDELFAAFLDPTFLDAYTMPMPPIIGSPSFPGLPPTSLALSAQVGVPTSSQTNHMPIASAPTLAIRPPSFNYSLTSIHPPSTSNTVGMRSSSLYKSSALFNAQQNSPYYPTGANQATPDYAVATAQPHLPSSNSVSTSDLQTYTKSSTISTSSQMNGYSSHQSQCPNLNPLPTGWNASADTSAWRGVRGISGISDAYLVALETADQRSGYHVPPSFEELAAINQHLDPVYSPRLVHRAPSFTQLPQTVPQSIDLFQATHPSDKPHRPVFDSELIPLGYPARPAEPFDTNSGEAKDGIDGKGSMVHCFKPAAAPLTTSLTTKRPIKASRQTLHVELDEDDDGYGGDSAGLEKQDCDCESLATFSDVCAMAFGTSQVNAYDLTSPSDLEAIRDASASQRPYHFRTRRLPSAGQAAPIPHSGPDKPFLEVAVSKGTSPNAYTGRNTYKTTSAAILDVPLTIPPYRPIRTLDEYYTYALRPLTPETLYDIPVMDQRIMILAPRSGSHLFPEEKIAHAVASGKFTRYIGWIERGDAIIILDLKGFIEHVMPHYFDTVKIESFLRNCSSHGLSRDGLVLTHKLLRRENKVLFDYFRSLDIGPKGVLRGVQPAPRLRSVTSAPALVSAWTEAAPPVLEDAVPCGTRSWTKTVKRKSGLEDEASRSPSTSRVKKVKSAPALGKTKRS